MNKFEELLKHGDVNKANEVVMYIEEFVKFIFGNHVRSYEHWSDNQTIYNLKDIVRCIEVCKFNLECEIEDMVENDLVDNEDDVWFRFPDLVSLIRASLELENKEQLK